MKIDLKLGSYVDTLVNVRADLILTSPPYNIGSKSPKRITRRRSGGYDAKSWGSIEGYEDALSENAYIESQRFFLAWCARHLKKGGTLVYNHKPVRKDGALRHPMQWIGQVPELTLMEEVIWDRGSTHNHSNRMMWQHTERLYVLRRTDSSYSLLNTNDLEFRSDVWRISPRCTANNPHNAPFPLALALACVKAWSARGQLVCDPYSGSGTTAIAAQATGRSFIGSEKLEKYHTLAKEMIRNAA